MDTILDRPAPFASDSRDVSRMSAWSIIGALFAVQTAMFLSYSTTYVESVPILLGDTNWYIYFAYEMYDALMDGNWSLFLRKMHEFPWGVLMWFESVLSQVLFGIGRTQLLLVNFGHLLLCQAGTYLFFSRLGRSRVLGLAGLALFMALGTPFRTLQGVHSILHFHPDLIATWLFIMLYYAIAASRLFATRRGTLGVSMLAVYLTYMRLVSFFTIVATMGILFALLLAHAYIVRGDARKATITRLKNFLLMGVLSYLPPLAAHFFFSWRAVGNHYFRFVFDEAFRQETLSHYNYGLSGALDGMHWVLKIAMTEDLGPLFFGLLTIFALLAVVGRVLARKEKTGITPGFFTETRFYYLFLLFLLCTGLVNLYQHGSFPVKSIHLTRLTMAPFFVLIASLATVMLPRIPIPRINSPRLLTAISCAFFIIPMVVQFQFYTSYWWPDDQRDDLAVVSGLYQDILDYTSAHRLDEIRISHNFAASPPGLLLGGGQQPSVYLMENDHRFLPAPPLFGSNMLKMYTPEEAQGLIDKSDILYLTATPAKNPQWQLDKASNAMFDWLHRYAKETMVFQKRTHVLGEDVDIYFRETPNIKWTITASSSVSDFYGPDWLLSEPRIWHCGWTGSPQWVGFVSRMPVKLASIGILSQVGAPARAPKSFVIQASVDNGGSWDTLLTVDDAGLSDATPNRHWALAPDKEYRRYRIYITANNGDPNLLTIQNISLRTQ